MFLVYSNVSDSSRGQTLCSTVSIAGKPSREEANALAEVTCDYSGETCLHWKDNCPFIQASYTIGTEGLVFSDCFPKQKRLMSSLWDYWMSAEGSLERTLQLPKEPARLLSLQLIFSVLVLFLQWRTSVQSRPCLCCPTWCGTPLGSNAEKSIGPQPKTVSSSSWWLMMLSAGDHGVFLVLPVGIKTIAWAFQHWIVAAVGFTAMSLAMGSASQEPDVPRTGASCAFHGCKKGLSCPFHKLSLILSNAFSLELTRKSFLTCPRKLLVKTHDQVHYRLCKYAGIYAQYMYVY